MKDAKEIARAICLHGCCHLAPKPEHCCDTHDAIAAAIEQARKDEREECADLVTEPVRDCRECWSVAGQMCGGFGAKTKCSQPGHERLKRLAERIRARGKGKG